MNDRHRAKFFWPGNGNYPYYEGNEIDYYSAINTVAGFIIDDELPRICKVELENTRKIRALMNILAAS